LRFYSRALEKKRVGKQLAGRLRRLKDKSEIARLLDDEGVEYWFPDDPHLLD
jgi:hypothetical protein